MGAGRYAVSGRGSTRARRRWRLLVLERDGWRCQVPDDDDPTRTCGAFADHADHVTPLSRGGAELDPANGRAACAHHNLSRGNRTDAQAAASRAARKSSRQGPRRPRSSREIFPARGWSW